MNNISSLIMKAFTEAIDATYESLAKDGVTALYNIINNSELADNPYMREVEVYSSIGKDKVTFTIVLNDRVLTDETRRKLRPENDHTFRNKVDTVINRSGSKEFVKQYMAGPDGRPERISGRRNGAKRMKDGRTFTRDARTIASDRDHIIHPKNSSVRNVDHELYATSPRGLEVEEDGRLRIVLQREMKKTAKSYVYPQGNYSGLIKEFVRKLEGIFEENFEKELTKVRGGK